MTHLICPLAPADAGALHTRCQAAATAGADLVELRLDRSLAAGARADELLAAISDAPLPILATARAADEGGAWDGTEARRLDLLLEADRAGAAWIDVELAAVERLPVRPERAGLVLSHHDFAGPGHHLAAIVAAMRRAGADVAKVAVTARDAADLAPVERLLAEAEGPVLALAMGEHGLPSRCLAGAWGSWGTFGRLDPDDPGTAPGQPTISDLAKRYRVASQGSETRIFGVIGDPVAHSLSPRIHNAAFCHDQLDAVYVPFRVGDPIAFWRACEAWIDGLSITIPHKQALLGDMAGNEDLALAIGAINTVYRDEQGAPIGANTDAQAALECLVAVHGDLSGTPALVLGAGGVARAVAFALHDAGCVVTIANRTEARAIELAAAVGCAATSLEAATRYDYAILVNGTSVGMGEDRSLWPATGHRPGSVVFDTVYTPLETRLLREAEAAGATCVCGLRMFIGQALGQYRRWTGAEPPVEVMRREALEGLGARECC